MATELTPAILRSMGCVSATGNFVLDDEGTANLEFKRQASLGGYGAEVTLGGKTWWVKSEGWNSEGEKFKRWTIELEDEEGRLNRTPYLGRPDWGDIFPLQRGLPKLARVSTLMTALGLEWNEEDAMVPVPSLSGGESIGDIKKQILHWVQRNVPPAGSAAVGSVLKYNADSTAKATGEIRMNFNLLPIGGLNSGFYVNGVPVMLGNSRVGAAGLATAINAMNAGVTATASGTRVNLTATTAGEDGNDITIGVRSEEGEVTLSDSTLSGGRDGHTEEQLVPGTAATTTHRFSWYGDYTVGIGSESYYFEKGTNTAPAMQLATEINADASCPVTAEVGEGSRVLLTAKTAGVAGNSIAIDKDAPDDYEISGPTLTGGADAQIETPAEGATLWLRVRNTAAWARLDARPMIDDYVFGYPGIISGASATIVAEGVRTAISASGAPYSSGIVTVESATSIRIDMPDGTEGNSWGIHFNQSFSLDNYLQNKAGIAYDELHANGGADAVYSDPVAATGWVDCCAGTIAINGSTFAEPPSSLPSDWATLVNESDDYEAEVNEGKITFFRRDPGALPLAVSGNVLYWTPETSTPGTDAHYEEREVDATPATGWFDLGETGLHPIIEHTGLFVNGIELQGAGLSAANVVSMLNANTDFGVTAALTSSSTADGVVYLTARESGAAGNEVSLSYIGAQNEQRPLTLSGTALTGGTKGAVQTVAMLGDRMTTTSVTPRYDLICPAAGTYGRFSLVVPDGASLAQPGALALYIAPAAIASDTGFAEDSKSRERIQDEAGQWMTVQGLKVPSGWSITGGTVNPADAAKFWGQFAQFQVLKNLASYIDWGDMTFYPVSKADAYPPADSGLAADAKQDPPENYRELVDGNIYIHTAGSFPASSESRNNPSGLHFCKGALRQTVRLNSIPQVMPKGFKLADLKRLFSDSSLDDSNRMVRSITLVVSGNFIDRRRKRYKTGTNEDGDVQQPQYIETESETAQETILLGDYSSALNSYYDQRQVLYHDVNIELPLTSDFDAQTVLGGQLVVQSGQTAACPVRQVSVDYLSKRVSVSAGSPDLLSFDELLERRIMLRDSFRGAISRAQEDDMDTGTGGSGGSSTTAERGDMTAPSISPSFSTATESAAVKNVPFAVFTKDGKTYIGEGTLSRGGKTATLQTTEIPDTVLKAGKNFRPKFIISGGQAKIVIEYDKR